MRPEVIRFPQIVGTENEERPAAYLLDTTGRIGDRHEVDPAVVLETLHSGPMGIKGTEFMRNGSRAYLDKGVECATPECQDPFELLEHSTAMDGVYLNALTSYAIDLSDKADSGVLIRHHRRVVDSTGETWACHDNISVSGYLGDALHRSILSGRPRSIDLRQVILLRHLMSRSFMSGAGYVGPEGLRYSQKGGSTEIFLTKNFAPVNRNLPSYFDVKGGHGRRLEVRSSDRNVNNAAAVMRVGGLALLVAALQTPIIANSEEWWKEITPRDGRIFNKLHITPEGTIKPSAALFEAVDYEQRLAEYSMGELKEYMDVPEAYLVIAGMRYAYCEDFKSLLAGNATIDLLADRSDWARKMRLLLDYVAVDPQHRTMTGIGAQAIDQNYDATTILVRGKEVLTKHGEGVKDQQDPRLPCAPDSARLARAMYEPPSTRAADRVQKLLAASGSITESGWNYMCTDPDGTKTEFWPTYEY